MHTEDIVLHRAIDAAQCLSEPEPPWTDILRSGRELVGAEGATFIVFEGRRLVTFESVDNDPVATRVYVDHYSAQDIMLSPDRPRPSGTWLDTEDALSGMDRERSEYYVDFMCGHRMRQIYSLILAEGRRSAAISFQRETIRGDGAALRQSPRVASYTNAVVRATARRHDVAQQWMQVLDEAANGFDECVMLLDRQACVLRHCPRLQAWLEGSGTGLCLRRGVLWHADVRGRDTLAGALVRVHSGDGSARKLYLRGAGTSSCRLDLARAPQLLRLGGESLALLRLRVERGQAATLDPVLLCAAFDLTGAEARVLCALAGGHSAVAHAQEQGVSINTVRRQVAGLMDTMDCHRQADVVRMALALR